MVGHALVGRQDLPIPEWLFAWGASLVLIVSFVALSVAWRAPAERGAAGARRPAGSRGCWSTRSLEFIAGAIGVLLLGVIVWSGLDGTEAPDRNFSVTFVFVTFWLGLVAAQRPLRRRLPGLQPVAGDRARRSAAPSALVARAVAAAALCAIRSGSAAGRRSPGSLGFVWLELVYGQSGFQTVGLTPETRRDRGHRLLRPTRSSAMALFGIERWIDRGETFSVYFGMFASLSPFEVRDGRLGLAARSRARRLGQVPGSRRRWFCSTIGATTFDGATEGALRRRSPTVFDWFARHRARTGRGAPDARTRSSWRCDRGRRRGSSGSGSTACTRCGPAPPVRELARAFAHALHPDRPRLPGRPLLQPRRLPGAGPVHLSALRPARATAPTTSAPRRAASTTA